MIADLRYQDIRAQVAARNSSTKKSRPAPNRKPHVRLVPMRAQTDAASGRPLDRNATFGQRRTGPSKKGKGRMMDDEERSIKFSTEGGVEMTFVPTRSGDEDQPKKGGENRRKGVETFGLGMEKGREEPDVVMSEGERHGRTQRRRGMRSGSKNVFRRM